MIKIVTAIIVALISVNASASEALTLPIKGGVDGDTIKTELQLPCPLCKVSIRIRGIDTPEKGKRAKCPKEAKLAERASTFTKVLIGGRKTMVVTNYDWDKYGGRIDADVSIEGTDVATALIENGLAVRYDGGKKPDWCM